jgi:hypothetical protein
MNDKKYPMASASAGSNHGCKVVSLDEHKAKKRRELVSRILDIQAKQLDEGRGV